MAVATRFPSSTSRCITFGLVQSGSATRLTAAASGSCNQTLGLVTPQLLRQARPPLLLCAHREQVIFVLPTELPVTRRTFNWAPVAVGAVLVGTLVSWSLPCGVGARHWFRGGKQTLLLDVWVRALPFMTA